MRFFGLVCHAADRFSSFFACGVPRFVLRLRNLANFVFLVILKYVVVFILKVITFSCFGISKNKTV